MQHCPYLSTSRFLFFLLTYDHNSPKVIDEPHWLQDLESYNGMSMSRESTSLKRLSSDCLKLAKQWYNIWTVFLNYCNFSGSAEALVRCGGNYSICSLLTLSVPREPNIMKIRQRFLELQLKMSEMLLLRHSVLLYMALYCAVYRIILHNIIHIIQIHVCNIMVCYNVTFRNVMSNWHNVM